MSNLSLAERSPTTAPEPGEPAYGPCFSSTRPPLPMGCKHCGHPPYEHGCDHMGAHEYEVPSRKQIDARWDLIRSARLDELGMPARDWVRPTKCAPAASETEAVPAEAAEAAAQPRPLVPAPRPAEPPAAAALPVESHQDRQARLARATEPQAMQRALAVAAVERPLREGQSPDQDERAADDVLVRQQGRHVPLDLFLAKPGESALCAYGHKFAPGALRCTSRMLPSQMPHAWRWQRDDGEQPQPRPAGGSATAVARMARLENEWLLARVLRHLEATADRTADSRRVGARRLRRRPGHARGASFPRIEHDQRRLGRVVTRQPGRDELAGVTA